MSKEEAYTPEDFQLKPPEPIDDPRALRDAIASDYQAGARRQGGEVSFVECQALAQADLQLVDSAQSDIDRVTAKNASAKPAPRPEPVITNPGNQSNVTLERRECTDQDSTRVGLDIEDMKSVTEERKLKLTMRIMQICEPISDVADLENCTHMAYPVWAKEIVRATINCEQGLRKYRGHSIADRRRMLLRDLEDTADRSRRDLGPWWVK